MKASDKVRQLLRERFGECADPVEVFDELFGSAVPDDGMAQRYVIVRAIMDRWERSCEPPGRFIEEVADEMRVVPITARRHIDAFLLVSNNDI